METRSVILLGVGGQGILLASEILAKAAMFAGYDVKTNEVHGMAQRGGSVTAQVRYGRNVASPLIPVSGACAVASLECIEALRAHELLTPGGKVVVNTQKIVPVTVSSGAMTYPADAEERLKKLYPGAILLDAGAIAADLGNIKAANVVIMGALSTALDDLPEDAWDKALAAAVKPQHLELNRKAFARGREFAKA